MNSSSHLLEWLFDGPSIYGRPSPGTLGPWGKLLILALILLSPGRSIAADTAKTHFGENIQPILEDYCYSCHGNGVKKGGMAFDGLESDGARLRDPKLWWSVLRNVRA